MLGAEGVGANCMSARATNQIPLEPTIAAEADKGSKAAHGEQEARSKDRSLLCPHPAGPLATPSWQGMPGSHWQSRKEVSRV